MRLYETNLSLTHSVVLRMPDWLSFRPTGLTANVPRLKDPFAGVMPDAVGATVSVGTFSEAGMSIRP